MKIQYILIVLYAALLSISKNINALEYQANHDQTYWFYDDENSHSGRHLTRVRANSAWGETINIFTIENKCNESFVTLVLHSDILKDMLEDEGVAINTWNDQEFIMQAKIDDSELFDLKTFIWFGNFNDEGRAMVHLLVDEIPVEFIRLSEDQKDFNKVMQLTIPKSNKFHKYFELHHRMYRMQGLVPTWIYAYDLCMGNTEKNFKEEE